MSIMNVIILLPKPLAVLAATVNSIATLLRADDKATGRPMPKPFPFFGE